MKQSEAINKTYKTCVVYLAGKKEQNSKKSKKGTIRLRKENARVVVAF